LQFDQKKQQHSYNEYSECHLYKLSKAQQTKTTSRISVAGGLLGNCEEVFTRDDTVGIYDSEVLKSVRTAWAWVEGLDGE
jgi:hypothetical protein